MDELIEVMKNQYELTVTDNRAVLRTPIMYMGADHTFSFYVERRGGRLVISDGGQTIGYLRENADPSGYAERIESICEYFEIEREGDELIGTLASIESNQTLRSFHKYIGALNMIAYTYAI